jgi:predicted ATPase
MKICYIWVKNFRNFNNLGLNLSSSSKFFYNSEENLLSKIEVDELPKDFFGENITEVTGIVGQNGVGKSNALELICKVLKNGKASLKGDFFIIVEELGKYTCYYSLLNNEHPKSNFKIVFEEYHGSINPLKVVFFSNVFDERRNDFEREVSDISVNNLHRGNIFLRADKITNFEKQINLINSKIFRSLNINTPTEIQFIAKSVNRLNSSRESLIYGENYEIINDFKKQFRERIRDISDQNKFIYLLRYGFFFEIFQRYYRKGRYDGVEFKTSIENLNTFIGSLISMRTTDEITEKMIDFLEFELIQTPEQIELFRERDGDFNFESKYEKFRNQIEFIRKLKFTVKELNKDLEISNVVEGSRNRGLDYFILSYKSPKAKKFINEYINLFERSYIFDVNWLGISSGHKAYLNLFASLFHELKHSRQQNLLLCIDEGDLYLHPKWQVEFFDKLISVLPKIFSGNIQLILTSHSPFLLSDLPKQNITILDNSINNSTDGFKLPINTFGGNLYDLYSFPFFLENKRTSDFAYNKIKELIEKVEKQQYSIQEKEELLKLSNILGDEIIQFRINKLLKDD